MKEKTFIPSFFHLIICIILFTRETRVPTHQTQKMCITSVQRRPNVFDVGHTLYKCYINVLYLLGYHHTLSHTVTCDYHGLSLDVLEYQNCYILHTSNDSMGEGGLKNRTHLKLILMWLVSGPLLFLKTNTVKCNYKGIGLMLLI